MQEQGALDWTGLHGCCCCSHSPSQPPIVIMATRPHHKSTSLACFATWLGSSAPPSQPGRLTSPRAAALLVRSVPSYSLQLLLLLLLLLPAAGTKQADEAATTPETGPTGGARAQLHLHMRACMAISPARQLALAHPLLSLHCVPVRGPPLRSDPSSSIFHFHRAAIQRHHFAMGWYYGRLRTVWFEV